MIPTGFESWPLNVPTQPLWLSSFLCQMKTGLCTEYIFTKTWYCTFQNLAQRSRRLQFQRWQNCEHNNPWTSSNVGGLLCCITTHERLEKHNNPWRSSKLLGSRLRCWEIAVLAEEVDFQWEPPPCFRRNDPSRISWQISTLSSHWFVFSDRPDTPDRRPGQKSLSSVGLGCLF